MVLLDDGEQSPGVMVTNARTPRFVWFLRLIWKRYQALGRAVGTIRRADQLDRASNTVLVQRFDGVITIRDG